MKTIFIYLAQKICIIDRWRSGIRGRPGLNIADAGVRHALSGNAKPMSLPAPARRVKIQEPIMIVHTFDGVTEECQETLWLVSSKDALGKESI